MTGSDRWRVVRIELSDCLPQMRPEAGYDGLYVIFFWHGTPLGHRRLSNEELPLAPHHVANVAAQAIAVAGGDYLLDEGFRSALPGLREPPIEDAEQTLRRLLNLERPMQQLTSRLSARMSAPRLALSVAICTRERPERLTCCLESILASTERPREIIVIDNAPQSDATRAVVARFPGVRYHEEPRRGLSAARNTALAVSSGDVVAFADDDVIVDANWVARMRRCFSDPAVMVVTGLVLPAEMETRAQALFENQCQFFHQGYRARKFDSEYFAATRARAAEVWSIGAGANMAIRREAFAKGYRFDTRLGPGAFGGCGEDSAFWYDLLADGSTCLYEPSAIVYHYHRRELGALRHLVRQYMQGHVAALILQAAKHRHWGNLRRLLLVLPFEYILLFLRFIVTGFSRDHRIMLSGAWGCVSGLRFAFTTGIWQRRPKEIV